MKIKFIFLLVFVISGCTVQFVDHPGFNSAICNNSKIIEVYKNHLVPANSGISNGKYIKVDGYRYANIFVEFEQEDNSEKPLSLGIVFANDKHGAIGARRYFCFDNNSTRLEKPTFIDASGLDSWHGSQWKKSSYLVRIPIMGPYLQVFPFNPHNKQRKFSVIIYLTQ